MAQASFEPGTFRSVVLRSAGSREGTRNYVGIMKPPILILHQPLLNKTNGFSKTIAGRSEFISYNLQDKPQDGLWLIKPAGY